MKNKKTIKMNKSNKYRLKYLQYPEYVVVKNSQETVAMGVNKSLYINLRFPLAVVFLFLSIIITAQNQTTSTQKHDEQVTIISSFDPSINQAYKINLSPRKIQFNIEKPEFKFQSLNINQPTQITLSPIKPVVINADKRMRLVKNSLKIGVGSLFSPLLDFFHSSGQKNDYRFDAHLYHLSLFKNIANYSPSPQSNTNVKLAYRKFIGSHILDADIIYSLKTNRYYGFKPADYTITPNESRLKQMYNLAKLNVVISSNYRNNKKLSHKINLEAYYYFDKYNTSETNANLNFDIHKNFDVSDILDYQELGISGAGSYFQNTDSMSSTNDILASVTPYFKGNYGMFNFYIGLNFNLLNTNNTKFYFYPILDVNINLIPDVLTVFGGLDGNVQKQSFLDLSELNPWVSSTISTDWDRTFKAYAGIRGNVANKVNFSTQISWQKFYNMYFFVNFPDDTVINYLVNTPFNKFITLHDDGSLFAISGEVTYLASKKVNINFGVVYNSYKLDSLQAPYHKPTSKIKLGISFMVTEKIKIWSDVYLYGKRTALNNSVLPNTQIDLDSFIDLNAGVDYKLTNQLTAFLSLTNLLNNQYRRYYHYPVNGIQVMGGILYKF